jgi:hypothetical protein
MLPFTYTPDRSLAVHGEFQSLLEESGHFKKITELAWAYHDVGDLIPHSLEALWSGHFFPWVESWEDLQISCTLCILGLYKQAMASLRSALELGLLGVIIVHVPTLIALLALASFAPVAIAKHPGCAGIERWATSTAFVHLKNANITNNDALDFTKTKTVRLASEKIGKDLYRQVHNVTFTEKSGRTIEVITVNDASNEECSMSGVQVFVVSKQLGGLNE